MEQQSTEGRRGRQQQQCPKCCTCSGVTKGGGRARKTQRRCPVPCLLLEPGASLAAARLLLAHVPAQALLQAGAAGPGPRPALSIVHATLRSVHAADKETSCSCMHAANLHALRPGPPHPRPQQSLPSPAC